MKMVLFIRVISIISIIQGTSSHKDTKCFVTFCFLHVLEQFSFAHDRKMTIWFVIVDKE